MDVDVEATVLARRRLTGQQVGCPGEQDLVRALLRYARGGQPILGAKRTIRRRRRRTLRLVRTVGRTPNEGAWMPCAIDAVGSKLFRRVRI